MNLICKVESNLHESINPFLKQTLILAKHQAFYVKMNYINLASKTIKSRTLKVLYVKKKDLLKS